MKPVRLLVTGASGFLGSHIMHLCDPADVVGVYQTHRPLEDGYCYLQADLSEEDGLNQLFQRLNPVRLIHAAAQSNLDWCERNSDMAWKINAEAPVMLAKTCAKIGCKYLFVSSDMVFDGEKGNYAEDEKVNPVSLYGKAKAAAEKGVLWENSGAIVARVALIYGLPVASGRGKSFLSWVLDRLGKNESVPLYYDQFRTPVEVRELADVLLKLVHGDFKGVMHVAGREKVDRLTFGKYVCKVTGYGEALLKKTALSEEDNIAPRPRDLSLQTQLLQNILGTRLSGCASALQRILRKQ